MRSIKKRVIAGLGCILSLVVISTSCGDFFPSSKAIVAMTLSPTSGLVAPGATTQFTATGTLGNNQSEDVTGMVNWSSSNTGVATINQAGLVTGVAVGNSTITASSGDVTVTAPLLVSTTTSFTITPSSATVAPGGTQQLTATDQASKNITSSVTWSSSDTSQATVSSTGLVTVSSAATPSSTVTITGTLGSLTATSTITIGL